VDVEAAIHVPDWRQDVPSVCDRVVHAIVEHAEIANPLIFALNSSLVTKFAYTTVWIFTK
jgi:hypothetical protein